MDPSGNYIMPIYPTPSLPCATDISNCETKIDAQVKVSQQLTDELY